MSLEHDSPSLEKIVSLCKRRGFVFQSAEIYSGLNGVYDFGPLGFFLKKNIKDTWIKSLLSSEYDIEFLDGSILGSEAVWRASGHLENFKDPMVDCLNCKKRFRADEISLEKSCPACGKKSWTEVRDFMLMFQTELGAMSGGTSRAYLRPETAQSIFINFKNVRTTMRSKIPFGIAQIGKAFRNEITPKQFLFRMREFEQMELEFFCDAKSAEEFFEFWKNERLSFYLKLGLDKSKLRIRQHSKEELAHYADACVDVEFNFNFGWKELEGIANRTNYDLSQHMKFSGKDLSVHNEISRDGSVKPSFVPYVIESSVGVERLFLALLFDAYTEERLENGETRVLLKIAPQIAPIKAALLPLSKKLSEPALKIFKELKKKGLSVQFDDSGSIGKRYRRQDEIGTPLCLTYDFDSVYDHSVTVRDRDSMKQERISVDSLEKYILNVTNPK